MRVSVRDDDPGYPNFVMGQKAFLDGVEVTTNCITADEELGEVLVYKLNSKGEKYYDDLLGEVPCETLKGNVKIVLDN